MLKFLHRKGLILTMLIVVLFSIVMPASDSFAAKPDKTPPTAPSNLKASAITTTAITLVWTASTDNVAVKSYDVYKNNALTLSTTSPTCTVSNLTAATTYSFYIKARDAAGNVSKPSITLTVSTAQPEPAPTPAPEPTPTPTPAAVKTIGYYAAWSAYSGYTPDNIDAARLTHINYAFANIGTDLKIAMGYPDIDPVNFAKLNALKTVNPNLKVLITVGGWTWSGRFSDAALTDASRTAFADSCVDFITRYGLDGVDIDWEYPVSGGLASNVRRPEDKTNFTLLMQKLREKLDARGALDGKHYLLSFAGAAGSWYLNNIEPLSVQSYVDYADVMTYDIHGIWDKYTDFNAPLYNSADASPQYKWSVDDTINALLKAGFTPEKLVMGIPFYGNRYDAVGNVNNGLYQTFTGGASISYASIASSYLNYPGFTRYYQTGSRVPWLFNGSTFISYEDEQSIGQKALYIKLKGLAGAMVWELSQDPGRVLLNALYNGLK